MPEQENVTVTEAAAILGVQKEKIAQLVKKGVLKSRPSTLDARRRLIPREQVEQLLIDEGRQPRTLQHSNRHTRIVGMVNDPSLQSQDLEDYFAAHWRPE